jgi:hypothetical protein
VHAQNAIQLENMLPGTNAWGDPGTSAAEGYASQTSVEAGETLNFHVSAPAGLQYRLDIYRVGWYGGPGGRLVTCLPSCSSTNNAVPYPTPGPDANGQVQAGWPVAATVTVPASWVTGYYMTRIVLSDGSEPGRIPFVVREPTNAAAPSLIVVQVPVNTWQAYNAWGGKSLYDFSSTGGSRANRVSFDRPYLFVGPGAQVMTSWELSLVRFLESEGYDVSYVTDTDVDRDPAVLRRHRIAITAGHGEYWTSGIRDAYDSGRGVGTNMLFMGANTGYWRVRQENARRTIITYKNGAADPTTTLFRDLPTPRPECALLGVQHYEGSYNWPRVGYVTNPYPTGSAWFANTNLAAGSMIDGIVSREHDLVPPGTNCGLPLQVLFHYTPVNDPLERAEAVRYTFPGSGARIFASGSLEFAWALNYYRPGGDGATTQVNTGIQQLVRNLLTNGRRPAPLSSVTTEVVTGRQLRIRIGVRGDPRVLRHRIYRRSDGTAPALTAPGWTLVCSPITARSCLNTVPAAGTYRYAAVAVDRWGPSVATYAAKRVVS